jgi:hypothetical protein
MTEVRIEDIMNAEESARPGNEGLPETSDCVL